jgi:class 3 adenylate cyclase
LRAVVESSGVTNTTVFAYDLFGVGSRFAARNPELLTRLVLFQPSVEDEHDGWFTQRQALVRRNVEGVGGDELLAAIAPSHLSDRSFREWYLRAGRMGASPAVASRIWESVFSSTSDEQLFEQVIVPTLVLYRGGNTYAPADAVQRAVAQLGRVSVVELEGADVFPFLGDVDAVVAEISQFLVGERRTPPPQRVLAAVLFTDLVDSTARAASIGDAKWKSLLDRHDAVIRAVVGQCGGTVVKGTGDGVVALLPSATAGLEVAEHVRRALAAEELSSRIGIHVGDVDRRGDDISGLAVHVAARVLATAGAGEIVVTESVVAAAGGPGQQFEPQGAHQLKGVPGEWALYRYEPLT